MSPEQYPALFDHLGCGVWATDRNDRLVYWNPAMSACAGTSAHQVIGRNPFEGATSALLYPFLLEYRRAKESLTAVDFASLPLSTPSGEICLLNGRLVPIMLDGHFAGIVCTVQVLGESPPEQHSRGEMLSRLQMLFNALPVACIVTDDKLRVQEWNPAAERIFGYPQKEIIGTNGIAAVVPPEQREHVQAIMERTMASDQPLEGVNWNIRKDGERILCHWLTTTFKDAQGRFSGYLAMACDITETERTRERLEYLNRELELKIRMGTAQLEAVNAELQTFAYTVSHDLKAPLRAVDGYARLLQMNFAHALPAEGRTFVNNIRQGARMMNDLIEDLLTYTRLEQHHPHADRVDVRGAVLEVLHERAREMEQRRIQVKLQLPEQQALADPDGLALVLRNLLDNAIKFTAHTPQPQLEIGGSSANTSYILWFKDNGIGFDMKFHDYIFEVFQRLHHAEEYPGTGVGLAIVRKALQRMGGRIWAEGQPDAGATFYIELPL